MKSQASGGSTMPWPKMPHGFQDPTHPVGPAEQLRELREKIATGDAAAAKDAAVPAVALNDSTKVGRYCSISWGCAVLGIEHPTERITTHLMSFREAWASDMTRRRGGAPTPAPFKSWLGPVTIGNDVWIGQDVRLRAGLTIGDGAVIASGSIVLKDVPSFAIVGGVPAKLIRYRLPEEVRARAASIRWWDYAPESFAGLSTEHPAAFLDGLERRIADGLQPYRPDKIDLGATVLAIDAAP